MKKIIAVTAIALLAAAFVYSGVMAAGEKGIASSGAGSEPVMVAGGGIDTPVPA